MLLGKKAEDCLESIAVSLKRIAGLMESNVSGSGTSLRTNYADGKEDASWFGEVDDTMEFLRELEAHARRVAGVGPSTDDGSEPTE